MPAHLNPPPCGVAAPRTRATRRRLLANALVCAAAALTGQLLGAGRARAAAKMQKSDAEYRDSPRGVMRCDRCLQFQPPASCKIVNGPISPSGSCDLFAPKPH